MDVHAQIEDLEVNIDELTDALSPLLTTPLQTTTSTLPLLDKAKLYVLLSYTIESLLFSSLQASGQNARDHPIFAELARLKPYFQKLQEAESGPTPKTRIDKEAVGRFVKHGLAGNDKFDAERMARERARDSLRRARGTHTKFGEARDEAAAARENEEPHGDDAARTSPSEERKPADDQPTARHKAPNPHKSTRSADKAHRRERKQMRRMKALKDAGPKEQQILPTSTEGADAGSAHTAPGRSAMPNQLLEGKKGGRGKKERGK